MGAAGRGERLAAAIAAVAVSLSILAGMNRLADGYVREALEGLATGDRHASARADRASSSKSFRCTGELIRTG